MTEALREIAWERAGVSPRAILGRHSRRHLMLESVGEPLCGIKVPWTRVHGSFEGDCKRCFNIARLRGLDPYG